MDKTSQTLAGATDTIFCAAVTLVFNLESMVLLIHTRVPIPDSMIFASLTTVFVVSTMLFVVLTIVLFTLTMVFITVIENLIRRPGSPCLPCGNEAGVKVFI